ncbi:MAG: YbfB/YjiJ family MFS transporter [Actinobacteria bacterium]|nr:YbfB/YjiJ family MFS transporter [Actinomycetota bacterium]
MIDKNASGAPRIRDNWNYAWVVLAIGTLCEFGAVGMGRFGYGMLIPAMQASLGMSNTEAGALATANLIGYLAMSALGGALATRFGPRIVIGLGVLVSGLGMVLTGFAAGPLTAAVWRAVTGVGTGGVNVPTMGLVSAWFSHKRRGMAVGILLGGNAAALIVSGVLFPKILTDLGDNGWRMCWYLVGGLTLVTSIIGLTLLRNPFTRKGLILRREQSATDTTVAADKTTASGSPKEAITTDESGTAPSDKSTLNWKLVYRSGPVMHLGLVYLTYGFSYIIFITFFTKRLMADMDYTKEAAGALFMLLGWLSLICGGLWGWFSDRFGRKPAIIAVYLIQTTSIALLATTGSTVTVVLSAIMFGLSSWSVPAIMAATCADAVGPRMAPAALGLITLFFGVGQAVGPTVAGAMADASGNFDNAFWLAAAIGAIGTLGVLPLRRKSISAACREF